MDEQQSNWAVVELFGHKTIAGQITKETNLFPLLRIDVPATSDYPAYTVEYGPTAIYGITYVSEAVAKATAESLKVRPINIYSPELVTREQFEKAIDQYKQQIAKLRALPERINHDGSDDEDDARRSSNGACGQDVTLSTANNSESNTAFTSTLYDSNTMIVQQFVHREVYLTLVSKTTYYLNSQGQTGMASIDFRGDKTPTLVVAQNPYI